MALMVIDPAVRRPELQSFNAIALRSPVPVSYHLPALHDFASFPEDPLGKNRVHGLILFGSGASVHDRFPWQLELERWCLPLMEAGIPTLGLCYGHQMLAHMFGGRVEWVFDDRHKHKGLRQLTLHTSPLGSGTRCLPISHAEAVTQLPPGFSVLAESPECAIDGLRHDTLPIYGFQPHPEATEDFLDTHGIERNAASLAALSDGAGILDRFLGLLPK